MKHCLISVFSLYWHFIRVKPCVILWTTKRLANKYKVGYIFENGKSVAKLCLHFIILHFPRLHFHHFCDITSVASTSCRLLSKFNQWPVFRRPLLVGAQRSWRHKSTVQYFHSSSYSFCKLPMWFWGSW